MSIATPAFFLRFDEADAGDAAADSSGNSRSFTATNSPPTTTGVLGGARSCRRSGSRYFSRADEAALRIGSGDFTLCGWFKMASHGGGYWSLASKGSYSSNSWYVYVEQAFAKLTMQVRVGGSNVVVQTDATTLSTGTWYFFAFRRTGSTWKLRVNGGADVTGSASGDVGDSSGALYVGNDDLGDVADCDLDMYWWGQEYLSDDDVAALYGGGAGYDPTAPASGAARRLVEHGLSHRTPLVGGSLVG